MTEQHLRDLMHDSVADVSTEDLADAAWERAVRARRRNRVAAVAGAAAAVVAIAGTVALVDRPTASPGPTPTTSNPRPSEDGRPDTQLGDLPVWWSPDAAAEALLPAIEPGRSELPPVIDLGSGAPDVGAAPIDRALAAFAVFDDSGVNRLLLLTADGDYRTLDVSGLAKVSMTNGYPADPEDVSMLSPDGRVLMFPQDGHLMLYRLETGEWRQIDTGTHESGYATWINDTEIYLPSTPDGGPGPIFDLAGDRTGSERFGQVAGADALGHLTAYGTWRTGPRSTAETFDPGPDIAVPDGYLGPPGFLATEDGQVLAFLWKAPGETRWKRCCPVAGWLDSTTVVYESRKTEPQLIAWTVGTHEFRAVATITGFTPGREAYVASFARLWG